MGYQKPLLPFLILIFPSSCPHSFSLMPGCPEWSPQFLASLAVTWWCGDLQTRAYTVNTERTLKKSSLKHTWTTHLAPSSLFLHWSAWNACRGAEARNSVLKASKQEALLDWEQVAGMVGGLSWELWTLNDLMQFPQNPQDPIFLFYLHEQVRNWYYVPATFMVVFLSHAAELHPRR